MNGLQKFKMLTALMADVVEVRTAKIGVRLEMGGSPVFTAWAECEAAVTVDEYGNYVIACSWATYHTRSRREAVEVVCSYARGVEL